MSTSALTSTRQLEELRQRHRDGKLPASVDPELTRVHGAAWAEYRDLPGSGKQWWITAEALKDFRSSHGRWPVLTRASEEQLAVWRKNQRHRFEDGLLRGDRREWLDDNVPRWLRDRKPGPKRSPHWDELWPEHARALSHKGFPFRRPFCTFHHTFHQVAERVLPRLGPE